MSIELKVPSVNFHLWEPCNMKCNFCFARFLDVKEDILPKGHMGRDDCVRVVELLSEASFDKITFAGGEPTLCPWLPDLIHTAKKRGMTTAIVTNGSRLTDKWLDAIDGHLDWVALSVDSVDPAILTRTGRTTRSGPMSEQEYLSIAERVKARGMRLKINTVVTADTLDDDLSGFIAAAQPERWKIFQVLPVDGQNDGSVEPLLIGRSQFRAYVNRNAASVNQRITVVAEDNGLMRGSYAMVDPAGRFYDNTKGRHTYSRPIIKVGVEKAIKEVSIDSDLFMQRGGLYDWRKQTN